MPWEPIVRQSEVRVRAEAVDWLWLGLLSVHWLEYLFLELWADFMLFLDTGSERGHIDQRTARSTNTLYPYIDCQDNCMLSFISEVLFNKRLKLPPGFSCFISCSVTVIMYNLDLQKKQKLTCAWADVWHVNQRPWVLDKGLVVQRHACAEVLGIHWLAELSVCHWYRCLVLPCGKQKMRRYNCMLDVSVKVLEHAWYSDTLINAVVKCSHMPICLMPSLSSMSSWTRGMSMCSLGPWGGPFTGVSILRLFLLHTHTQERTHLVFQRCVKTP